MNQFIFLGFGLIVAWIIFTFNRLVQDRNRTKSAWSDIDVQLKRRYDLIPKLVDVVKGYGSYERDVLENVTKLRAQGEKTQDPKLRSEIEGLVNQHLSSLLIIAEAYPDLKASTIYLDLMKELTHTEDQLQYARRHFNGAVLVFNNRIESFPDLFIAKAFHFEKSVFFELENPLERKVPEVKI
jgi:LemA protein